MPMTWLELYHLRKLCKKYEIDEAEIDNSLNYGENKTHILTFAHTLHLPIDEEDMLEEADAWADRILDRLVEDCRQIINQERREIKLAKHNIGRRILQDEEWLTHSYGDNYIGRLARRLDMRGYSASQLYCCVAFARHPQAEEWLRNDEVTWEQIRRQYLRRETRTIMRFLTCGEATPLLRQLAEVYVRNKSLNQSPCNGCPTKKVCEYAKKFFV